jgi:hypothetical protein
MVGGTYLFHAVAISGNCGTIPDTLTIIGAPMIGPGASCRSVYSRLSADHCRVDFESVCGQVTVVGYLELLAADGSVLAGEESASDGVCAGTYAIRYTKQ